LGIGAKVRIFCCNLERSELLLGGFEMRSSVNFASYGSLLFTDNGNGTSYRVTYAKEKMTASANMTSAKTK